MEHDVSEFRPKTPTEQVIEARYRRPVETVIHELYTGEGLSQAQVAKRLQVSRQWVIDFMKARRMPTRDRRAVKIA